MQSYPTLHYSIVMGVLNFTLPGDPPISLSSLSSASDAHVPSETAQRASLWNKALKGWVNLDPHTHTHFIRASRGLDRIDRLLVPESSWVLGLRKYVSSVPANPVTLNSGGISAHAPLLVVLTPPARIPFENRPIRRSLFKTPDSLSTSRVKSRVPSCLVFHVGQNTRYAFATPP